MTPQRIGILSQLSVCGYEIRKSLWIIAVHECGMFRFDDPAGGGMEKIAQRGEVMKPVSQDVCFFR